MKIERDERRFDFHDIGLAIKRAREASGMTQEQLAYIVDRAPRTIMYNENDGQHPSLNTFYQMVTMFDISVDQYFYPSKNKGSECRKRMLYCPSSLLFPSKKAIPDNERLPFSSLSGSFSRHFKLHKRNFCGKAICTIHFLISNTEMAI
ncbi:helix-turn-helix transcriptional regulator [Faecalibacterium prausnitzii]|uniref:helix-turn-helix transcriptional regulator n=2 Tax=Faecalibacterium prausnitzii TaxID=853 RepID=UPI003D2E8AC1